MPKGLPWVRISSEIAFDGEIEMVSDAAFRTYVEIIAISGHYLLDGSVPLRQVRKLCNTAKLDAALKELAAGSHPYLRIDGGTVVIVAYQKWQQTAEQVESERQATAKRVRKHRTSKDSNGVAEPVTDGATDGVSEENRNALPSVRVQSKSEEGEEEIEKNAAALAFQPAREAEPPADNGGGGDSPDEPERAEEPTTDDPLLWDLWAIPGWKRDDVADPKLLATLAKANPRANLSQAIGEVATQGLAGTLKTTPAAALPAFVRLLQQKAPPPYVAPPRQPREHELEATPDDLKAQAATLRACMEDAGIRPLRVAGGAP